MHLMEMLFTRDEETQLLCGLDVRHGDGDKAGTHAVTAAHGGSMRLVCDTRIKRYDSTAVIGDEV